MQHLSAVLVKSHALLRNKSLSSPARKMSASAAEAALSISFNVHLTMSLSIKDSKHAHDCARRTLSCLRSLPACVTGVAWLRKPGKAAGEEANQVWEVPST